jgi:hypothetical protein
MTTTNILCIGCEKNTIAVDLDEFKELNRLEKKKASMCSQCLLDQIAKISTTTSRSQNKISKTIPNIVALWKCRCCGKISRSKHMIVEIFEYDVCEKCHCQNKHRKKRVHVVPVLVVKPVAKTALQRFHENNTVLPPAHFIDEFAINQSVNILLYDNDLINSQTTELLKKVKKVKTYKQKSISKFHQFS